VRHRRAASARCRARGLHPVGSPGGGHRRGHRRRADRAAGAGKWRVPGPP
jgi:hypothetical protein